MKSNILFLFLLIFFFIGQVNAQEIFKNSIKDFTISLKKTADGQFSLNVTKQKKVIFKKSYPILKLYFYNLDTEPEDEMIVVSGQVNNQDTLNMMYVFTFVKNFQLCDSIYLDKYYPEFYKFDFDKNYFIKVYDYEIEKAFPASRNELPFSFYYLNNCLLEYDNENSFEEFEAEINYLVDQIARIKNYFNCDNISLKNDLLRLLACLYTTINNAGMSFDFENYIKKNYPCHDETEFLNKLKSLYE